MAYHPVRRRPIPSSRGRATRAGAIVILLLAAFAGSVYAFRGMSNTEEQKKKAETSAALPAVTNAALDVTPASAVFSDVEHGGGAGTVLRDAKDSRYHLAIHATLPTVDLTQTSYEAWLFSLLPFDYVPLGELTTDNSGAFVLDWEGTAGLTYATYRQVIITRQAKADDANPGAHVLEGTFPN